MRGPLQKPLLLACAAFVLAASGCGYTTRSLLPPQFKTIYVDNFANGIKVYEEQSDERMYRSYRPGMEKNITKAVIDRYIFDGNLKIVNDRATADLVLKGELIDFRREALRYDNNDNVEEYRILVTVTMEMTEGATGKLVWGEKDFSGETTYRTSGSLAKSEATAINDAMQDLARRIVERTIEVW